MVTVMTSDPRNIAMQMVASYVERQLGNPVVPKAAEMMGHYMVGAKIARQYKVDIAEQGSTILSREYLRGAIADLTRV